MRLPYALDDGPGARAAIGLILLQTDVVAEVEIATAFPEPDVALHHGRIPFDPQVRPETLARMGAALPEAAALLPGARPLDAVAYCCTSGATMIGAERVDAAIRAAHPTAAVTDPLRAVCAALSALRAKRIALLTPYRADVTAALAETLSAAGFEVAACGSFEQETDALVARIAPASVEAAMIELGAGDDVDVVFGSCTNLRGFGSIAKVEAALGKPAITSNLALAWMLRRLCGLPTAEAGPGRLFATSETAAPAPAALQA